jgi:hypothetical protein
MAGLQGFENANVAPDDDNEDLIPNDADVNAADVNEIDHGDGQNNDGQEDVNNNVINANMDERYGPRMGPYNLGPRRERDFGHLFTNNGIPLSTPQMNMSQGIAMFGSDGIAAVKTVLLQLHERNPTTI